MSESPRKEGEEDFHPLNVIQPEKWNNIPICIIDAFRIVISETKANDLKIKFLQDKLLETQKRVDKQIKNVEKMMTTVENSMNENINQFKEATKKTQNSLSFEIGLVSERSNDNMHNTNVLQRKLEELDKNVNNNYKLKVECAEEMKKIITDVTVQVEISQSYLKELLNVKFHELSEIPGLAGPGKQYPDLKSLVRELHDNYQAKANFLDEIAENRDEYFKRVCGRVIDEMNLPQKLKTTIRNDLKPEIIKECVGKLDEKLEITKEEINTIVQKSLNEIKSTNEKSMAALDEKLKALEQKQNQSVSKLESGIRYVSSESDKKATAIQFKFKQIVDDMASKGFAPDKNLLQGMNDGIKRQSVLYTPNPQDMMRFNESPPLMQNHQEGMRPNIGEGNKRVSMLHNPQDIQRNLQDKSQSGSVQNQVSGPSTIEDQTSGTKLNVNEVQALGNSNLIFNQDGRPISRNQRESLRESTEDRPNSRTQNQRMSFGEHAEENISRPMSRSQRPNNESGEENRPFSRSQRNTLIESGEDMRPNSSQKKMSIIEYGNESRPISRSQKQTLIESADGTSIEEVQEQSIYQQKEDNYESRNNIPDDMVSYKDDPRNFEMRNEEYHYEQEYNEGYYGDPKGNGPYGYPGSVSSKHSFLMGPIKANVETQTAQENMLAVLSNFDITKMEPYTLEFLRVLEGELSNMRYGIKEVKDEKNGEGLRENERKTQRDVSPQTFDNILQDLKSDPNDQKKGRPRTTGINPARVKLSPMLMLKMISRRKELENKMKQINELSMENKINPEPMISIKSHSVDFKLNRGLDSSMVNNPYGNNTIRETKEYLENDDRDNSRFTYQSSPGNKGNKKNKAEDTNDLIMNEEKKFGAENVFLPSILKKPLNTKMAEIGFDPKTKEEILQQKLLNETATSLPKPQRPKPPEKKQVTQTEWKKKVESFL